MAWYDGALAPSQPWTGYDPAYGGQAPGGGYAPLPPGYAPGPMLPWTGLPPGGLVPGVNPGYGGYDPSTGGGGPTVPPGWNPVAPPGSPVPQPWGGPGGAWMPPTPADDPRGGRQAPASGGGPTAGQTAGRQTLDSSGGSGAYGADRPVPNPGPPARPWYAFAGGGNQQDWGQAGLSNLPQEQQLFYDVNPSLVNRAVETYANADPLSHYRQYVSAQMPGMEQDFARYTAQPGNAAAHYSDYVQQRYNDLARGFGSLSPTQRGENPLAFGGGEGTAPGRMVFR